MKLSKTAIRELTAKYRDILMKCFVIACAMTFVGVSSGAIAGVNITGVDASNKVTGSSAGGTDSVAMGYNTTASGNYSTAIGYSSTAEGTGSFAGGLNSFTTDNYSMAMGVATKAKNEAAIALGRETVASGLASIAMGSFSTASGNTSTAFGEKTTASGDYSTAMGYTSYAVGTGSVASGNAVVEYGGTSFWDRFITKYESAGLALGSGSIAMGTGAIAGVNAIQNSTSTYADVALNKDDVDTSMTVLDASINKIKASTKETNANQIAMGYHAWSTGENAVAMGGSSTASGDNALAMMGGIAKAENSIALGFEATVAETHTGSVALGSNSITSGVNEISVGYYNSETDNLLRRITNVADGVNAHDVATFGQVSELASDINTAIGDRTDIGSTNAMINSGVATSVAQGFYATGNAIGDQQYTHHRYVTQGSDLTKAVSALDYGLSNVETRVDALDTRVDKYHEETKAGFASLSALSALVPNAKNEASTQLAGGMGYYHGKTGFALGAFHYLNDNVLLNVGGSYANDSSAALRAGFNIGF